MSTASPGRGFVCVTLAAVLFAVNASVSKVVLDAGVDPARLTAVRCTGAALGLGLVLLAVAPGRLRVTTRELPALVGLGLAGAAMVQWLYFVAIDRLPVGVALLLEFTAPALVALYARVVRREYVRSRTWLAIGLGFGGLPWSHRYGATQVSTRSALLPVWVPHCAWRPICWSEAVPRRPATPLR
jgi:drug/metabolite transporter (DMT)-like permease